MLKDEYVEGSRQISNAVLSVTGGTGLIFCDVGSNELCQWRSRAVHRTRSTAFLLISTDGEEDILSLHYSSSVIHEIRSSYVAVAYPIISCRKEGMMGHRRVVFFFSSPLPPFSVRWFTISGSLWLAASPFISLSCGSINFWPHDCSGWWRALIRLSQISRTDTRATLPLVRCAAFRLPKRWSWYSRSLGRMQGTWCLKDCIIMSYVLINVLFLPFYSVDSWAHWERRSSVQNIKDHGLWFGQRSL